ncbi:MAG: hypothetical protein WKG07_25860 [Hymenobacter sp.]
MKNLVLGLAALTTGLVAGLYFAFEVAVNPAFAHLPDREYPAGHAGNQRRYSEPGVRGQLLRGPAAAAALWYWWPGSHGGSGWGC